MTLATSFLRAPWASPLKVSSQLLERPVHEPLTLAQGKLRAGLDWPEGDPRDDLMAGFIAAARQQVEQDTGLALIHQVRLITMAVLPGEVLPLPAQAMPLLELVDAETGEPVPIIATAPAGWPARFTRRLEGPGVLLDATTRMWTWPEGASGTWKVTAGWPDRNTFATEAPLLYYAVGLLTAHFATMGRDVVSTEEGFVVPHGYDEAIQPFRAIWLT